MKYFFIVFFLLGSFTAFSQVEKDSAEFTFEKTFHDFGDIIEGDSVEYTFNFKNTGKDTLVIDWVISSCGCTPVYNDTIPVLPGGKGKIVVGFRSEGKMGIINKQITIASNAKKDKGSTNPFKSLRIRANVLPRKK